MNYRLFAIILAACILVSGTALAGFGETKGKINGTQLSLRLAPSLGAQISPTATAEGISPPAATYVQQGPPAPQQKAVLSFDVNSQPASVYYGGTYLGWSSFASTFPADYPLFWISTSKGWSWYATLPLGSWVQEHMYIPTSGSLKVFEVYPTGITQMYDFGLANQGYRYIWFNGDTPGKHVIFFTINDVPSNAVMVDVSSAIPPTPPIPGGLQVGDTFTKAIPANPSTGYHWEASYDQNVIRLVEKHFEPGSGSM